MIDSRRLFSNAALSVLQTVISGLLLFVLYRYLLDHLGAEQLGLWSVVLASTSVARLSDLGLTGSVVKFVARYRARKDDEQAAEVVQTAALTIALVMGVLALAVYPFLEFVLRLSLPASAMPKASSILPWAVLSLWVGSIGGAFQSGLDGCQRMDIRNILMIVGNLVYFGASLLLVRHYGLVGLALGQAAQALLLLLLNWLALRRQLSMLPWVPINWSRSKFHEMFGYALSFQINSVAILLFDPITKILMSRYGGLTSAAYYEMASQMVIKLRALLVSANQALVAAVAELHETSPDQVRTLYIQTYNLMLFFALPFYASLLISLPAVSTLWIGHLEDQFLAFGTLLIAGWCLNTLSSPAYFSNLGTGNLKWNSISHVVMGIVTLLLGLVLGPLFGGLGIAISSAVALAIASGIVIVARHVNYQIPLRALVPAQHHRLIFGVLTAVTISTLLNSFSFLNVNAERSGAIGLGLCIFSIGIVMWIHPYRKLLIRNINSTRST